ncbi:MAG: GNAT family N-acetyltransferase [Clostridia bacterium]|nr:GNAT family N-acetyltransferase [Clostridia bacterium]
MAEFRTAQREDCEKILFFIRQLSIYEKMEHLVTAEVTQIEKWLFDRHAAQVVFAMEDGKEVGFALYFFNFSTFLGKSGLYLEDLFVLPEYRGRGIGKSLMQHLASICVKEGLGRFEWWCLDWNEPSIAFYKSLGAVPMDEWTTYRLQGEALQKLGE